MMSYCHHPQIEIIDENAQPHDAEEKNQLSHSHPF